jgi:hypothetical protein
MKKITNILLMLLAMTLVLTACGEAGGDSDKKGTTTTTEDAGPNINYEDYIDPVVDRKVGDYITAAELSTLMSVEVSPIITTDSVVTYQSENGYYMVTLALENKTRAEFDAMIAENPVWTSQSGLGEVAYWGVDQTELIAYQDGYAVSVSGYHVIPGCIQSIMQRLLKNLQG